MIRNTQRSIAILLFTMLTVSCAGVESIAESTGGVKSTVLVAGATGKTGREVVKHLLAADMNVRVLVRNEEKAKSIFGDTVEVYVADIKDAEAVSGAFDGINDVISAIGSSAPSGPNSPEFVDYGGIKNLVDGSVAAKVDQFVLVSSLGATKIDHPLNKAFGNVLVWKLKGEESLRDSGLSYTIVRPGGLTEDAGRAGKLQTDQGDKLEGGRISRDDVAEICVAALSEQGSRNKTFEVISEPGSVERDWSNLFGGLQAD